MAAQPKRVGRHRQAGVLVKDLRERIDVVALECGSIALDQRGLGLCELGARLTWIARGEGGTCTLQRACDRGNRGLEAVRDLRRGPTKHVREQEDGALLRRQMLERRHERQPDALAEYDLLGWIGIDRQRARVGNGLE